MKLSDFNYNIPRELLAEFPSENRDESRLMVLNRENRSISHHKFKDLIDFFVEDDIMVLNNTKVLEIIIFANCARWQNIYNKHFGCSKLL